MKKLGKVGRELELLPDARQRAAHKGREIAKALRKQRHAMEKFDIEVVDVNPIPQGVEVFARVFNKDGSQVGFGDGTVDVERFRFVNPPILVPDGEDFVEDAERALLSSLDHTVSVVKRNGPERIERGKVGSTVSTFYPDAHTESTSVDGVVRSEDANWATARAAATGTFADDSGTTLTIFARDLAGSYWIYRAAVLFDTSAIPDTDVISAATVSLYGQTAATDADTTDVDCVSSTPASNTAITTADFDQFGSTVFGSFALSGWSTSAYNDITLDASGISNITPTGISKFGFRNSRDTDNAFPTGVNSVVAYSADQTGTTNDPKLVVTHAASGPAASRRSVIVA